MMFLEHDSVLHRYDAAKAFGFKGVELWFPYTIPIEDITKKRQESGVEQILINSFPGELIKSNLIICQYGQDLFRSY